MAKQMTQSVLAPGPLRVAAYARVSTMNQVRANDSSIDTQLSLIRDRAEFETRQAVHRAGGRGWSIVEEYREEGRSAKNLARPSLQRLLADVRAGKIDVVVVVKIDRITRSTVDFYNLWEVLKAHNVDFVALNDNFDTSNATGRAMVGVTLVFAQLERERTSERTKEKIDSRRRAGLWFGGAIPFGYQPHPTDKTTLAVDPVASAVLREIFSRYLEGSSARALTRHLGKAGIIRPVAKNKRGEERGGGPFTTQAILNMLACRVYVAERKLDSGEVVECHWPALVERSLWDRVQVRLEANSVDRPSGRECIDHVYLLEGILRCGRCGALMSRSSATGRTGDRYFYYRCGNKHRTASEGCKVRDVPVDAAEKFVLEQVRRIAADSATVELAVRAANEGRDSELARVQKDLARARGLHAATSKAVTALVDAVEKDAVEGGQNGPALRRRLREREAEGGTQRVNLEDLMVREEELRRKVLDGAVVAEAYRALPDLLRHTEKAKNWGGLRALLQVLVRDVEWHEETPGGRRGRAVLELMELPKGYFQAPIDALERERPGAPPFSGVSPGRPEWLPRHDSNMRPGD